MNTASSVKVIIHQSRGEVSLVEQAIIDYVSTASLEPKIKFLKNSKKSFYKRDTITQLFSADAKAEFQFY